MVIVPLTFVMSDTEGGFKREVGYSVHCTVNGDRTSRLPVKRKEQQWLAE